MNPPLELLADVHVDPDGPHRDAVRAHLSTARTSREHPLSASERAGMYVTQSTLFMEKEIGGS